MTYGDSITCPRSASLVSIIVALYSSRYCGAQCNQNHKVHHIDMAAQVHVGAVSANCQCLLRVHLDLDGVSRMCMSSSSYFISVKQLIGTYATYIFQSPIEPWSTLITLLIVMLITSVIHGLEDIRRAKSDQFENSAEVSICHFVDGELVEERTTSERIRTGDIVKVYEGRSVPADLVILWTALSQGGNQCYIETSNIDGETNLKLRQVRLFEQYRGNLCVTLVIVCCVGFE